MKVLLFGKDGQVGWELHRSLQTFGNVVSLGRQDIDFSNLDSLREIIQTIRPDIIVNAVAYTAVDKAESELESAEVINGIAPEVIANESLKLGALLIHYSTDYVFDGKNTVAYLETDKPNPQSVYGRTKLMGDIAVQSSGCDYLIFRTSWVYAARGKNFLLTILKLANERNELKVVSDQVGSPTSARLISDTTILCVQQAKNERIKGTFASGLYNLTTSGSTNWYLFSKKIIGLCEQKYNFLLNVENVKAITTLEYPTPAKRPMHSQLDIKKLESKFDIVMPDWETTLRLCVEEVQ